MKKITELEKIISESYSNINGIIISHDGKTEYERYFNGYSAEDTVHVASVTKSIISALVGIAIDKGYISGTDSHVLDYFPDYTVKRGEKVIGSITIENMLTMTSPYKYRSEPYTKVYTSTDWTKAALDLLGGKCFTGEFRYSTVGTQILSGIIASASGMSVREFAAENLFKPLGINPPENTPIQNRDEHFAFLKSRNVSGWAVDPTGMNTAGWGLTLTPRDMEKIGRLYMNMGIYSQKRLISSEWIAKSTAEHSKWSLKGVKYKYGYLWWLVPDGYAALGDGGNIIYVNPKKRLCVAAASSFMPRAADRLELISKEIEPMF